MFCRIAKLHYIVILHQTTTHAMVTKKHTMLHYIVILHQTTTDTSSKNALKMLHYIVILHQTTTVCTPFLSAIRCIISLFYIKPQPAHNHNDQRESCIISLFYIKPQPQCHPVNRLCVALYRYSTSNHNRAALAALTPEVALYRYSTSNHNVYHLNH